MKTLRVSALLAGLLVATVACTDDTGIEADGPMFFTVEVNDTPWTVTSIEALTEGGQMVVKGSHVVPDSDAKYDLLVSFQHFHGAGTYPLMVGTQVVVVQYLGGRMADVRATSPLGSDPPIQVMEYRASDTTVTGTFEVTAHDTEGDAPTWKVSGSFRVRPGYF